MGGTLVQDIMTKNVISVDESASVKTAADTMAKNRVGSLIVKSESGPVGIVTESDIIKKVVSRGADTKRTRVGEVMNTPVIFASPEQSVTDAASIMTANRVRRLPVIQNNKIVGIVTHTDIVRASPAMISLLEERLRMREVSAEIPTRESRIRVGSMAGLCECCGKYSTGLEVFDEEWACENCSNEKRAKGGERKKRGFKDWSRMS
ncbi:MAG: CBS domain-containing protein [Candidatus Aenigmarchaeota archaeon]|nr:CBS domain-containing protein [Candidatus Aenigmarchaeota archaeon]